jgi:hypothetical protein
MTGESGPQGPDWHDTYAWPEPRRAAIYLGVTIERLWVLVEHHGLPVHFLGPEKNIVRFNDDELMVFARTEWMEREAEILRRTEESCSRRTVGWVYFIEAAEVGRIKIGYSGAPSVRSGDMLTGSPVDHEIIGVLRGTKVIESQVKAGFLAIRWKREWFRDTPWLRAFMAEFASDPSVVAALPAIEMPTREAKILLDATAETIASWLTANPSPFPEP